MEYILLFIVIVFLLYNLMDSCSCANRWDGFSVGAQLRDPPTQKCSDLIKQGKGGCNFYPGGEKGCKVGDCQYSTFCGESEANCKTCKGTYCSDKPEPPAPPPPPPGPPAPPPQHGTKIIPRNSFTPENIRDNLILSDQTLNVIYMNNTAQTQSGVNYWWCEGSVDKDNPYNCFKNEFEKLINHGYNVIILTFYNNKEGCSGLGSDGCGDTLGLWQQIPDESKSELIKYINSKGAAILGSFGGATAKPDSDDGCVWSYDNFINNLSNNLSKSLYLNGIDIDLENPGMQRSTDTKCVQNLYKLTSAIRSVFKKNNKPEPIITSAPQTPYFIKGTFGLDYAEFENKYPDAIDLHNIQFYNQCSKPCKVYNTYESLFSSKDKNPSHPTLEYILENVPLLYKKMVVGKCSYPECYNNDNCDNGDYLDAKTLYKYIDKFGDSDGKKPRGVMYWQLYPSPDPESCTTITPSVTGKGMNGYEWISTYYKPELPGPSPGPSPGPPPKPPGPPPKPPPKPKCKIGVVPSCRAGICCPGHTCVGKEISGKTIWECK